MEFLMKNLLLSLLLYVPLLASELVITSQDGFELHAWLEKPQNVKGGSPIVLLAHQFDANHTTWDQLTQKLNAKGYATLSVDLRGHGKSTIQHGKVNDVVYATEMSKMKEALSQSKNKVGFSKIPEDLIAWIELLTVDKSIDMDRLYLIGSSLGASSLLPLLSEYEAKAFVSLSTGKNDSAEAQMALSTSMTPSWFIAADNDPLGASQNALEYGKRAIIGTAFILSGDGHGTVLLPKVERYILTFLEAHP